MKEQILNFISRRFSIDANWMNGNCYYFALILSSRFNGEIVYDLIDGHFLFEDANEHQLYDWTGWRADLNYQMPQLIHWNKYKEIDSLHYERIMRDCIM